MNKIIPACGYILTSLSRLPRTIFAKDVSQNQSLRETAPNELQHEQLQPLTLV